ncbi:PREDICTED: inositol 1,4,5-trisphosphate receptor type 1-like [Chinchilla lanigera]|uniref:inositol 1,4,5-trisphosphate receptor type 1-like n=1 Tax=Chinchilla lanigera TaxID=34839 RepID=UPI0006960F89|nr:PREDICTED: inositol 1,4,5-trisphosphate receptor type 1-like [Chinchilla lanigera]
MSQDVDNYKQIKQDLDQLRSIVEKSELWVYKGQGPDEITDGASGENEHKKTEEGNNKSQKHESTSSYNYRVVKEILIRLSKLCVQESASVRKSRKQQQRLLRNMGAHAVVLELLQIPYEKVSFPCPRTLLPKVSQVPRFPQSPRTLILLVKVCNRCDYCD